MNEWITLASSFVAGGALGGVFFGGLWWTIGKGLSSPRPALWFIGSFFLRISIALAGFYFVSSGAWARVLFCLLGFIVARFGVTWLTRSSRPNLEVRDAS